MTARLRAQATVEGAFLAAVAVLLYLISQVPMLYAVGNLLCPVPLVFVGVRHGLRTSLLAAGVATVVLLWVSVFHALMFLLLFGLLGAALGEGIRRRLPWGMVVIIGTVVSVAAAAPTMAITRAWMGVDLVAEFLSAPDHALMWLRANAAGDPTILRFIESTVQQLPYFKATFPAMLVLSAMAMALFNVGASVWLLGRFNMRPPALPVPTRFRCYDACVWGMVTGLGLLLTARNTGLLSGSSADGVALFALPDGMTDPLRWVMGLNILFLFAMLYVVQGLAIAGFFFDEWTRAWQVKARAAGTLPLVRLARLLVLLFVLSQFGMTLMFAGVLDTWLDFRKLRVTPAGLPAGGGKSG